MGDEGDAQRMMILYLCPVDTDRDGPLIFVVRFERVIRKKLPHEQVSKASLTEIPGGEGINESLRAVVDLVPGDVPQAHAGEILLG
jgi:hypothetical protein